MLAATAKPKPASPQARPAGARFRPAPASGRLPHGRAPRIPIGPRLPRPAPSSSANLRATALILASSLCFSLGDTIVKWLAQDFPVAQIVLFRSLACLPLLLLLRRADEPLLPRDLLHPVLLARSAFEIGVTAAFFGALALMPLGDAVAIMFTAPILLTALAGPLLGERVGWRRWLAVLAGFSGVLVVLRPGAGVYGSEAVLPLLAAACIAGRDLLVRRLPAGLDNRTVVLATTLALLLYGAVASLWSWQPPTTALLLGATAAAVTVTLAFLAYVDATRTAEVSYLQPFKYGAIPLSYLWGFLVFDDLPDALALLGVALIVGSGLFLWHRERALASRRRLAAEAR
ncbi:MAG: EamA family transporter [Geminicoccaceae bacterium]|nr:EamA family transporter [Geminicoccaceae bacterium]